MEERMPGDPLEEPQPAPEDDLADEGGPTQAGAHRDETPNPPLAST